MGQPYSAYWISPRLLDIAADGLPVLRRQALQPLAHRLTAGFGSEKDRRNTLEWPQQIMCTSQGTFLQAPEMPP